MQVPGSVLSGVIHAVFVCVVFENIKKIQYYSSNNKSGPLFVTHITLH